MSDINTAYLLAGGMRMDHAEVRRCLSIPLRECGSPSPAVAYIGTASGDDRRFFSALKKLIIEAGAGSVELLRLASEDADAAAAAAKLRAADAVFISGGEVWDGMYWLRRHGLTELLRELFAGGKVFFGLSAGTIMMGRNWVRWENEDDDSTAELFDCLGFAPLTFDTHAEDEDWKELKTALRLMGPGSHGYGIPSCGMIAADSAGSITELAGKLLRFENDGGAVKKL